MPRGSLRYFGLMVSGRERNEIESNGRGPETDEPEKSDVTPEEEERGVTVEEESEQSFPASDPPSY